MALDPNEVTQCGLTQDQIDAREAQYVREANDALAELWYRDCKWWLYSVSHRTFEVVIGGPLDHDNVVIALAGCDHIAGPVTWPNQQLRVVLHSDQLAVEDCNRKRSGLKSAPFWDRINCNYRHHQDHIICN